MKVLAVVDERLLKYLAAHGVLVESVSYDIIYHGVVEDSLCDALLIDISAGNAEGLFTPRSLIGKGHSVPIIGLLDENEVADERSFEEAQAQFISQGGMYLLKNSSSPALLKACIANAATVSGKRVTQNVPIRTFCENDVELRANFQTHTVTVNQKMVHLTLREYQVLELLMSRPGQTVTKEMVLGHLYYGIDTPEIKIIDVFVHKVRKKLGPASSFIETVWGRGYRVAERIASQSKVA